MPGNIQSLVRRYNMISVCCAWIRLDVLGCAWMCHNTNLIWHLYYDFIFRGSSIHTCVTKVLISGADDKTRRKILRNKRGNNDIETTKHIRLC